MKRTKIPNKILLIRTDRIGDVVLTTPAIRAVRHHFPKSFIAMMIQPYTAGIVKNNPHLNEIIIYDKRGKHKSYLKSFLFSKELRRKGFDLAFIFHPTNRVNIITFLAGIPERIGYNRKCGFLLNEKIVDEKFKGEKHEIDYNLEVISRRGVFNEPRDVAMYLTRRLRGEKLEAIGRGFNISKYSSVSSAIEKTRKEILANAKLKRRMSKVEALLTNSQTQN